MVVSNLVSFNKIGKTTLLKERSVLVVSVLVVSVLVVSVLVVSVLVVSVLVVSVLVVSIKTIIKISSYAKVV